MVYSSCRRWKAPSAGSHLVWGAAEVVAGWVSDTVCIPVDQVSRATYRRLLSTARRRIAVLESLVNDDFVMVSCRAWHPDGRRVSIVGRTRSQGSFWSLLRSPTVHQR